MRKLLEIGWGKAFNGAQSKLVGDVRRTIWIPAFAGMTNQWEFVDDSERNVG